MWKLAGISMLLLAGQAYGNQEVGCQARQQAVAEQLASARAHGNGEQVAGLERALRNIEAHCTDAGLLEESDEQLVELKAKVDERLSELQSARVAGKPDKIAKKQGKLDEAQAKYQQALIHNGALRALVESKGK